MENLFYKTNAFIHNAVLLGIFSVIVITVLTFNPCFLFLLIPIFILKKLFI